MKKIPRPPGHLSAEMKRWWNDFLKTYDLEASELLLLQAACVSWDRASAAREHIAKIGAVLDDRFGQRKMNPSCGIERDSLATFTRILRQLMGSDDGYESAARLPRI